MIKTSHFRLRAVNVILVFIVCLGAPFEPFVCDGAGTISKLDQRDMASASVETGSSATTSGTPSVIGVGVRM